MEHQSIINISVSAYMGKAVTSAMGLQYVRNEDYENYFRKDDFMRAIVRRNPPTRQNLRQHS